jgi:hypothetical protein
MALVLESGTVVGIICHIKARSPGGPRYDPAQSERDRHSFGNLILLCPSHGKVIDSELRAHTSALLQQWKAAHEAGQRPIRSVRMKVADSLLRNYEVINITARGHVMLDSPGAIQASTVVIKRDGRPIFRIAPPEGAIGSDVSTRNYIKYLIDRYNEFARQQPGRSFKHVVIYESIRREFRAKWDMVSTNRFSDLTSFLQSKIDGTWIGRTNRAAGRPNYSDVGTFRAKSETPKAAQPK